MAKLYNLARMTTATVGTGTITLGAAVSGYLTFALAGVANGDVVSYGIKDGANSEVGTGTYTSAGTTLTRTPTKSTNSDAAISLSGTAEVFITARKEDIFNAADPLASAQVAAQSDQETSTSTTLAVTPGRQQYHPSSSKFWVHFNGTGVVAIVGSYNVSSITDGGVGVYTINLTTAFSSTSFCAVGDSRGMVTSSNAGGTNTASAISVQTYTSSTGAVADTASVYFVGYGDQ